MKRDWGDLFKRYRVVTSPSQVVDYLDCPRKWWFRRVQRLKPADDAKKFVLGNALHGVIQRWLEADDTGRGKDGREVDLYPERIEETNEDGEVEVSKWNEGLTPKESQLVQMLAQKMIEQGIVRRLPERLVEVEFEYELVPGVGMVGALDVASPEGVEDHKSTKARKWASTTNDLAKDPKMLSYAKVWFDNYEGERCLLRLNYATKDPKKPEVWPVVAQVEREPVEEYWNETIVGAAQGMLALKQSGKAADDWRDITGPCSKDACQKYGGCPYARICGRMTTPAKLKAELDLLRKNTTPTTKPKTQEKPMSIFGKKKSAPSPSPVVAKAAEPEPEQQTATAVAEDLPPWHSPGCLACKEHPGLNSKGDICKACNARSAREGRPTAEGFDWGLDSDGNLWWTPKEGAQAAQAAPSAAPASKGKVQVTPPVKSPQAGPGRPKKITPAKAPAPAPIEKTIDEAGNVVNAETGEVLEAAPAPATRGRGRPKGSKNKPKAGETSVSQEAAEAAPERQESPIVDPSQGFDLFINAIPAGEEFVDLMQVLHNEGAELAAALGAENYYTVDAFKRRDFLASKAADVARELAGQTVVAIGGGQDMKVYLEALRPYARRVVIGVF